MFSIFNDLKVMLIIYYVGNLEFCNVIFIKKKLILLYCVDYFWFIKIDIIFGLMFV